MTRIKEAGVLFHRTGPLTSFRGPGALVGREARPLVELPLHLAGKIQHPNESDANRSIDTTSTTVRDILPKTKPQQ